MMRQPHLQLRTPENESPQHQPRPVLQHGPPGLIHQSQTLFNEQLQNQQFQQLFSAAQPQQFQHDLLHRVQRQQQQQPPPQVRQQQEQQQNQNLPQQDGVKNSTSASFSQNQDQLIQNLVGNWTVPNQTGRYNPFGLALNESNDSVQDAVKEVEQSKKTDKSVRRFVKYMVL